MRIIQVVLCIFLFSVSVAFASSEGHKHKEEHEHEEKSPPLTIGDPPKKIDDYYPPVSQKFEWVQVMHGMSGGFKGAWIDAKQGEWDNAVKNAQTLEESYKKAADMAGADWKKKYFKIDAASAFTKAVQSKDMKTMESAAKELGGTCHKCHYEQYSNFWLKYYWSDIDSIKLEDPITEKKLSFEDYKHALMNSFYTLMNDGKQGDFASAKKAGKMFVQRYRGLKASCMKCHEDEKVKYFFVGGKVEEAVQVLSEVLQEKPLDMGAVFKEIGVIGRYGCKKCHLTHRMASILKKGQEK